MNVSQALASFASGLTLSALSEETVREINVRVVDYIASAAAGYKVNGEMNRIVADVLRRQGGDKQATLLFSREKMSASQAAYYNAFVCNGADMDDGHMLANGHPGVCVIPPVLALAEWRKIGYEDTAPAIAAGYEVFIRLASAIAPSHLRRGFNGTGTSGTVASAAACARALRLGPEATNTAIGLAATSASGLMELNVSGQAMKPINPAKSACNGLMCALLAESGAVGPEAPLDGGKGFIKAFSDEADIASITAGLGEKLLMDTAYIKLYPACRHMHAMVDCAIALNRRGITGPDGIAEIKLSTYPASEKLTGAIRYPNGADEAKFSLTYAAAAALATGGFTLEDLDAASDIAPKIKALIGKMKIEVCPELEDRQRMIRGARMEAVMLDGKTQSADVKVPKGEKSNPLGKDDLRKKLSACASGMLSEDKCGKLYAAGMDFEDVKDIAAFYSLAAPEV